jgi:hypothetical protein
MLIVQFLYFRLYKVRYSPSAVKQIIYLTPELIMQMLKYLRYLGLLLLYYRPL